MKILFSEKVVEYERKDEYVQAMKQTYAEWQHNKTDENLCKTLLEYFFIMFKSFDLNSSDYPEWKEITDAAYERMEKNRELSFFVGYTMFIGFYLIPADRWGTGAEATRYIEAHGKELMEEAYEAEPDCTLFRLHHRLYWGGDEYDLTEQEAAEMREKFPIPSVVNEYFRRILVSDTDEEKNLPRFEKYCESQLPPSEKSDSCKLSLDEIYARYMEKETWIKYVKEEKRYLKYEKPVLLEYLKTGDTCERCRICGKKLVDASEDRRMAYCEPDSNNWICEDCYQVFKTILW